MKTLNIKNKLKYLTMFFLGLSGIFFVTTAFNITPIAPNAIVYIKSIFLTTSGTNSSATGIILEGSGGHAWLKGSMTVESLPNVAVIGTNASGRLVTSTSGAVYNLISGYVASTTGYRNGNGIDIYNSNGGNVGIGTDIPTDNKLQIEGNITSRGLVTRGEGIEANGENATAMGYRTHANGTGATAMGSNTRAIGEDSTSMGYATSASGMYATVMGYYSRANGPASTAMGSSTANEPLSVSMGNATTANGYASVAIGQYNIGFPNSVFEIGIGISGGLQNAMTVQNNGTITFPLYPDISVLATNASGTLLAGTSGSLYNLISGFIVTGISYRSLNGSDIYKNNTDNVGIGTQTPKTSLQVVGSLIAGDINNSVNFNSSNSSVLGGITNIITGSNSVINGGINNSISGNFSMIPGGGDNIVVGNYSLAGGQSGFALHNNAFIWNGASKGGAGTTAVDHQFVINAENGVGINTNDTTGAALTVAGAVIATRFVATQPSAGAYMYSGTLSMNLPDYVFEYYFDNNTIINPTYKFLALDDVKTFVIEQGHLPRVPSRAEIKKDGSVNLQALIMTILEKVEEAYLYMFTIDDKVNTLQSIVDQQKTQIQVLQQEVAALKK